MEHHSSENTVVKNFQDGTKNKPHPLEKSSDSKLHDKTEPIHHMDDKVCNVELISTRRRKVRNVLTRMKGNYYEFQIQLLNTNAIFNAYNQ